MEKTGIEILRAKQLSNGNYFVLCYAEDYSPIKYPDLFSDTNIQQQLMNKDAYVSIITDKDFNVLNINLLHIRKLGEYPFTMDFRVEEFDEYIYFAFYNRVMKLNIDGSVVYNKELSKNASVITFYERKWYYITNNSAVGDTFLVVFDGDTEEENHYYTSSDPEAKVFIYEGLAVDDTGIYVLGIVIYNSKPSHNHTYYYTPGAWESFQKEGDSAVSAAFLSKYDIENPSQRIWSTYLGGKGHIMPFFVGYQGVGIVNKLSIIDEELYALVCIREGSNVTTSNVFLEQLPPEDKSDYHSVMMKFNKNNSHLLMGTYINKISPAENIEFVSGSKSDNILILSKAERYQTHKLTTTANAPYPNHPYVPSGYDMSNAYYLNAFDSNGNRKWATYLSDSYGVNVSDAALVPNDEQTGDNIMIFCKNSHNSVLDSHITSNDILLNYNLLPGDKTSSIVKYKYNGTFSTNMFQKDSFTAYPNPVENVLYLQGENNLSIAKINVFDSLGNKIFTTQYHNGIEVSHLLPGVYYVGITMIDGSMRNLKFVKK